MHRVENLTAPYILLKNFVILQISFNKFLAHTFSTKLETEKSKHRVSIRDPLLFEQFRAFIKEKTLSMTNEPFSNRKHESKEPVSL